jgi:chromosome segregation ATPase
MFATPKKEGAKPPQDSPAPAPPALPKSSSKSIRSKALGMFKLGDKILPDAAARLQEASFKATASFKAATAATIPGAAPEASFKSSTPSKEAVAKDSQAQAGAFEAMISDLSKLRVQLRRTNEELQAEKQASSDLRAKVQELGVREERRAELRANGKHEQALVEELKRMDGLVQEERAEMTGLRARVRQLEDELDDTTGTQLDKIRELETLVGELRDKLTQASLAASSANRSSGGGAGKDGLELVAARQQIEQLRGLVQTKATAHTAELAGLKTLVEQLKELATEKTTETQALQLKSKALEEQNLALTVQLASTTNEFAVTMQQAVEEVTRLEQDVKVHETKRAEAEAKLAATQPPAPPSAEARNSMIQQRKAQEQQRDQAVAAAKKLLTQKKISQREYDAVANAAEQACQTLWG